MTRVAKQRLIRNGRRRRFEILEERRIPKAKDQTDAQYQAGLMDDKLFKSIKEGLKEGDKERMKHFGDKLSDDENKALIARVRPFKK